MDEEAFYIIYKDVKIGKQIKVTWFIPAETSSTGREVLFSEPSDQGRLEGIENNTLFIRRNDETLKNYPLSSIKNIQVLS